MRNLAVRAWVLIGVTTCLLALVGCRQVGTEPGERALSATPAAPSPRTRAGDAAAIRQLVDSQRQGMDQFDIERLVETTCAQRKDEWRTLWNESVIPMSQLGTADDAATPQFVGRLREEWRTTYPTVSSGAVDSVVDAFAAQNKSAFRTAYLGFLAEAFAVSDAKVEDIVVTGDTAQADVTYTSEFAGGPPETEKTPTPFVFEDGRWKDCEPARR